MDEQPREPAAWRLGDEDTSERHFILVSQAAQDQINTLRRLAITDNQADLHAQVVALHQILNRIEDVTTYRPAALEEAHTRAVAQERDAALEERDQALEGEAHLQQRLRDAELIANRLARLEPPAGERGDPTRPEKIADPDKYDGTREKLKTFKSQLLLKTSGNPRRFPNVQHKLRYAFQFLTGKAERTMRIHLRRMVGEDGEESYEVLFDTFAAFLAALDRHFGDPDEQHTAAIALDKLRQTNREFGAYYADFQELMDILGYEDPARRHALERGLNEETLDALAVNPAPENEPFERFVERLNALDCRLRARATRRKNPGQNRSPQQRTAPAAPSNPGNPKPATTTATGTAAGPMDLSGSRKRLTAEERLRRRNLGLCMYCGGVGHFAAECPARRGPQRTLAAAATGPPATPEDDDPTESGNAPTQA